jgi:hypothetical protein
MKICVFFLIELLPFIIKVGDWALRWTEGNAAVQHDDWEKKHDEENLDSSVAFCPP